MLEKFQAEDLFEAWIDLESRGKVWTTRFNKGLSMMGKAFPETLPVVGRVLMPIADCRLPNNTMKMLGELICDASNAYSNRPYHQN